MIDGMLSLLLLLRLGWGLSLLLLIQPRLDPRMHLSLLLLALLIYPRLRLVMGLWALLLRGL